MVSLVVMATQTHPAAFIAARALGGLGYGFAWMGIQSHLYATTLPERRASATAGLIAGIFVGQMCGTAIGAMLAEQLGYANVFLVAALFMVMPLVVALASWLWLGERLRPMGYAGLLAGVLGVTIIMGARLQGGADPWGVMLCVLGVLSLAAATMSVRGAVSGGNIMMIVGLQMLVGSALLWPFALALETPEVTWSWTLVVAFGYTVLIPGVAATLVWVLLVERIGAIQAATFHFLNPFFGVAVAAVLLGEPMGRYDVIGVVIVTLGILAVQRSRAALR